MARRLFVIDGKRLIRAGTGCNISTAGDISWKWKVAITPECYLSNFYSDDLSAGSLLVKVRGGYGITSC